MNNAAGIEALKRSGSRNHSQKGVGGRRDGGSWVEADHVLQNGGLTLLRQ